jgi:hypothetical protein
MKTSSVENQFSSAGFFNGPRRGGGDDEGGNGDYNEYFFLALAGLAEHRRCPRRSCVLRSCLMGI